MRPGARRWIPLLLAAVAVFAGAGRYAPRPALTGEHRVVHAVAHVAAVPVHVFGAVADAAAPASVTAPILLLLLILAVTGVSVPRARRTPLVPARAPPRREARSGS